MKFVGGVAVCLLAAVGGCTKSDIIPVTGVITLDGKPLKNADLIFQLQPLGRPVSSARSDEQGRFTLSTEEHQAGALIGTHKVAVRKLTLEGVQGEDGLSGLSYPGQMREIWEIPEKYGKLETSPLAVEVKPDMSPVEIKLKSEPAAE